MAGLGLARLGESALRQEYNRDPESFKTKILHELNIRSLPSFEKALLGLPPFEVPQRWAFNLLWRAQKWVQAEGSLQLAMAFFQTVGVRDENELKKLVGHAKSAEGVTLDLALQEAIEVVRLVMKVEPKLLAGQVCPCCGGGFADMVAIRPKRSRSRATVDA